LSLRSRQTLGKYRVESKLGEGGFGAVYRAYDTIEGVRVAIKVPHARRLDRETLALFRTEARFHAVLDHPNVLPIKYAGYIDDRFIVVYPLGVETLEERLSRRMSLKKAMSLAEQMLDAVAFAHRKRILHGDLKPENFILFHGEKIRLADFGLAKLTRGTLAASGSGTVGYVAPEQAMGKPSLRSDVFSLGLILFRLFGGGLPEWPFDWPPRGAARLKEKLGAPMLEFFRKAISVDSRRRFADAAQMRAAFQRMRRASLARGSRRRRRRATDESGARWRQVRFREFQARFRAVLDTRFRCSKCHGPVSEPMQACPWCGTTRSKHRGETSMPARCPRCRRGRKLDWRFCAWCYGEGFREVADRYYSDVRYVARCGAAGCPDRRLMPFTRYCPWCRRKVRKAWTFQGTTARCPRCRCGVVSEFWEYCPWCARGIGGR